MRGITPVISVVLLAVITVLLAGFAWLFFPEAFNAYRGCLRVTDFSAGGLTVKNCGATLIPTFTVTINGTEVGTFEANRTLTPGEARNFHLHFLPNDKLQTIRLVAPGVIETVQLDTSRGWVIAPALTPTLEGGIPKLTVTGNVYLNDGSGDVYKTRPIEYAVYRITGNPETPLEIVFSGENTTNEDGEFRIGPNPWDLNGGFSTLFPQQFWEVDNSFSAQLAPVILQPPNSVIYHDDVDGDELPEEVSIPTQEPYFLLSNRTVLWGGKDVIPLSIANDNIAYRFSHFLTLAQQSDPRSGDDLWYGTVFFPSYAGKTQPEAVEEVAIACQGATLPGGSTFDADCSSGTASVRLTSKESELNPQGKPWVDGKKFEVEIPIEDQEIAFTVVSENTGETPVIHSLSGSIGLVGWYDNGEYPTYFPDYYNLGSFQLGSFKLVPAGGQREWAVTVKMQTLLQALAQRYGGSDPSFLTDAYFLLQMNAIPPNPRPDTFLGSTLFNFAINVPPEAAIFTLEDDYQCGVPSGGNPLGFGYCDLPARALYWKLKDQLDPDPAKNTVTLAADFTANRPATGTAALRGMQEFAFRVKPPGEKAGDVVEMWQAGSGMVYPGASLSTLTFLDIPNQAQHLAAYAVGRPTGFSETANVITKVRIMNVWSVPEGEDLTQFTFNNITVYKRRGQRTTCAAEGLSAGGSVACSLTADTQPGELLSTYANRQASGTDLAVSSPALGSLPALSCAFTVSGEPPNCQLESISDCTQFVPASVCHFVSYNRPGQELFELVAKDGLTPASASLTIEQPTGPGAAASLTLWNWYLTTKILWNNQYTHILTLRTLDPGNFYPAYVEKPFLV